MCLTTLGSYSTVPGVAVEDEVDAEAEEEEVAEEEDFEVAEEEDAVAAEEDTAEEEEDEVAVEASVVAEEDAVAAADGAAEEEGEAEEEGLTNCKSRFLTSFIVTTTSNLRPKSQHFLFKLIFLYKLTHYVLDHRLD